MTLDVQNPLGIVAISLDEHFGQMPVVFTMITLDVKLV
jgi:hypothetical protein